MSMVANPRTRTLTASSVLILTLVLAGCLAPAVPPSGPLAADATVPVWVVDHGWHTSIVVRQADVDSSAWPESKEFPVATFVEVAWGDRDYFMAKQPTLSLALQAALATRGSTLHVSGFSTPIAAYFPKADSVELRLARPAFDAMTRFVSAEYQRDAEGKPTQLGEGLYGESWFYAARSKYDLLNTCNTWVARALEVAGFPLKTEASMTATGVMNQLKDLARSQ